MLDFIAFTQQVMDSLNPVELKDFLQLQGENCYKREYLRENQLIKSNRDVARWLVIHDGRNLQYVGQFRDDPEIVRKAVEDRFGSMIYIGEKLASDGEFIKQIMKDFSDASYDALKSSSPAIQSDPEVVQVYLERDQTKYGTGKETLRSHEEDRRCAHNFFTPKCEAILDELLNCYEYYTNTFDMPPAEAFAMMRAERIPAMKNGIVSVDLPEME